MGRFDVMLLVCEAPAPALLATGADVIDCVLDCLAGVVELNESSSTRLLGLDGENGSGCRFDLSSEGMLDLE